MNALADVVRVARLPWALRRFLRQRVPIEEARAVVQRRMAERESNFLRFVERGIFGYSRSPYRPLLDQAGCQLGDIQRMVRDKGLENTLRALRESGVYVTFEEFKGRTPIARHGRLLPVRPEHFDNPYLTRYYRSRSGGTTGSPTRVAIDFDQLAAEIPLVMLGSEAHGTLDCPIAVWRPTLPDHTGIKTILIRAATGNVPRKWFSPISGRDFSVRSSLRSWLAARATGGAVLLARRLGVPLPRPEPVAPEQGAVVARWVAETLAAHAACLIHTSVSLALRVCIAAREQGLDLTGATFMGASEPPTSGKVREITRTGARYVPTYWMSEAGPIGWGCGRPADENDLHFFRDSLALVQYPREVSGWDITVDAFYFTTLLPTAPKLMLNVESDDFGLVENRSCGCLLESYGFSDHLRHVRSFSKLTGEGVTLVGSDILHILEDVLPARFGGSPLDYQLLEEEDGQGFTRLNLLISPRVQVADEAAVTKALLEAVGECNTVTQAIWSRAGTVRIKRKEPIWTTRGKLMPLHVAERATRGAEP